LTKYDDFGLKLLVFDSFNRKSQRNNRKLYKQTKFFITKWHLFYV